MSMQVRETVRVARGDRVSAVAGAGTAILVSLPAHTQSPYISRYDVDGILCCNTSRRPNG
jgi:hypothetical protein